MAVCTCTGDDDGGEGGGGGGQGGCWCAIIAAKQLCMHTTLVYSKS